MRTFLAPALILTFIAGVPSHASAQRRGGVSVAHAPVRGPIAAPVHAPVRSVGVVRGGYYGGYYRPYPYYYGGYYRPYYYYPYYGGVHIGFGFGFGFGYPYWPAYGWYGYPYGYGYPYPAVYGVDDPTSSVRLEVTPKNTEVYVDGSRAGTVDDFDGFSQRLRVNPGEHELVLFLDGYRTVHQRVYLSRGADQKIRYTMIPLVAGEQQEARPQAPADLGNEEPPPPPGASRVVPRGPAPGGPPPPGRPGPPVPRMPATYGSIAVRVQPADADVLIDGEHWTSSGGERLVVQLAEGRHHVEIVKDGYERYSNDVQVNRGETLPLNVSLARR